MRKTLLIFSVLVSVLSFGCPFSFAEEQQAQGAQTKYVNGKVAGIDLFKKEITIKTISADGKTEQAKFVVDQHTKIFKKDLLLNLTDIRPDDEVIVEYIVSPMSFTSNRASRIRVKAANEGTQNY